MVTGAATIPDDAGKCSFSLPEHNLINHPIPVGTRVIVEKKTKGPARIQRIGTRIKEFEKTDDGYVYTLLDGRTVNASAIIEVKE